MLGGLPSRAGLVWTDGDNPGNPHLVVFEAFDTNGITLGTNSATLGDNDNYGGTAEDRFFGVEHAGGISSIKIYGLSNGGIEIDHLQYSFTPTLTNCPKLSIRRSQNPQSQQVDICWPSTGGANYQLLYASELTTNNWINLGAAVSGNGTTNCITDSYANGQPRRFYRLNCF